MYLTVRRAEAGINAGIEKNALAPEVLQRIAEDIDRMVVSDTDVEMAFENKFEGGYNKARLIIQNRLFDKENKPVVFEKIEWVAALSDRPDVNGLILYRSRSGFSLEDKILDVEKQQYELDRYVPICGGLTQFKIEALENEQVKNAWSGTKMPPAVRISISFAEPVEMTDGSFGILPEQVFQRTIAVDRSREISFIFVRTDFADLAADMPEDSNDVSDANAPSGEPNSANSVNENPQNQPDIPGLPQLPQLKR